MTVVLPTLPQWTGIDQERHKQRAIQAIAHERCVTDLTDGFCGPRDGKCQRQGSRQGECIKQAVACVRAMETNGVFPIWIYDQIFKAENGCGNG